VKRKTNNSTTVPASPKGGKARLKIFNSNAPDGNIASSINFDAADKSKAQNPKWHQGTVSLNQSMDSNNLGSYNI
jgi:hypothetical protein